VTESERVTEPVRVTVANFVVGRPLLLCVWVTEAVRERERVRVTELVREFDLMAEVVENP